MSALPTDRPTDRPDLTRTGDGGTQRPFEAFPPPPRFFPSIYLSGLGHRQLALIPHLRSLFCSSSSWFLVAFRSLFPNSLHGRSSSFFVACSTTVLHPGRVAGRQGGRPGGRPSFLPSVRPPIHPPLVQSLRSSNRSVVLIHTAVFPSVRLSAVARTFHLLLH